MTRVNPNLARDYCFSEPISPIPSTPRTASPLKPNAPTVPDLRGDDRSGIVEAYDRRVAEIVEWAKTPHTCCGALCLPHLGLHSIECDAANNRDPIPDRLEITACPCELPSLMEMRDATRGTPYFTEEEFEAAEREAAR